MNVLSTKANSTVVKANFSPRNMDFAFTPAALPRYYADNNPLLTAIMNTLSAAIPEGERFFVESVRHFRDRVSDPVLKKEISAFIGQEAFHAREHDAFNRALLQNGVSMERHERIFAIPINLMRRMPQKFQLAATAALEHYTAIIAEQLLRSPDMREKLAPISRAFWEWHALEETEHKAVAFDVYETVSGSYSLRAGTMLLISAVYWPLVLSMSFKMVIDDGRIFNVREVLKGLNIALGRKGFFSTLAPKYLDYLKPGFHPNDHNTDALLAEWHERLFGSQGLLAGNVK